MSLPRVCLYLAWCWVAVSAAFGAPPARAKPRLDRYGDPLPPGAVARLGTLRFSGWRFFSGVLVFSPDAKHLAIGDVEADGGVAVTDARTGRQLWHFSDDKWFTTPPVFSLDGKQLAAGCREEVFLWDARTGHELRRFRWREKIIELVWFAPDGKTLAAAGRGGNACWWDVATGKERRRWTFFAGKKIRRRGTDGVERFVTPLAFSPDGRILVYQTSRPKDGNPAAETSTFGIAAWDTRRGAELWRLEPLALGIRAFPQAGEGKYFVLLDEGSLSFRSLRTGKELRCVKWTGKERSREPVELALSADGKVLASGHSDASVCLWDVASGKLRRRLQPRWAGPIPDELSGEAIALSGDGKSLATRRGYWTRLWDTTTGRETPTFEGHRSWVIGLYFTPDGSSLCTRSFCRFIRWKRQGWREAGRFDLRPEWRYTGPSPPGKDVVVTDEKDGKLWLCDLTTGKAVRPVVADQSRCDGGQLSCDGKVLALLSGEGDVRDIVLHATKNGKVLRRIARVKKPEDLLFSADGKILIWYDKDGRFWAVDVTSDRPARRIGKAQFHPRWEIVWSTVSPDGRRLATAFWINGLPLGSGGTEAKLRLWDTITGKGLLTFENTAEGVAALRFSPDGRMLAASSLDSPLVHVWEVATGKERFRLGGHRERVQCLAFSPDGKLLLSGGDDGTVLVWDICRPPRK